MNLLVILTWLLSAAFTLSMHLTAPSSVTEGEPFAVQWARDSTTPPTLQFEIWSGSPSASTVPVQKLLSLSTKAAMTGTVEVTLNAVGDYVLIPVNNSLVNPPLDVGPSSTIQVMALALASSTTSSVDESETQAQTSAGNTATTIPTISSSSTATEGTVSSSDSSNAGSTTTYSNGTIAVITGANQSNEKSGTASSTFAMGAGAINTLSTGISLSSKSYGGSASSPSSGGTSPNNGDPSSSGSLSEKPKTGLIIGLVVGLLILVISAILVLFFIRRRRRSKTQTFFSEKMVRKRRSSHPFFRAMALRRETSDSEDAVAPARMSEDSASPNLDDKYTSRMGGGYRDTEDDDDGQSISVASLDKDGHTSWHNTRVR